METPIWDFPEAIELEQIEQRTLPRLIPDGSPFFENFPFEPREDTLIRWEQEGNYTGLMNFRGYGSKPGRVVRVPWQGYMATPGVYGEFIMLEEEELTRRRRAATFGTKIPIEDMVAAAQRQLLTRRIARQEKILADLTIYGTYSVPDASGATMKTDSYTPQTSASSIAWSNWSTATPIADIRTAQLVPFGQSVDMGPSARIYMNRVQFNNMIRNTNTNDLGGRRLLGLTPANSIGMINEILAAENLPQIMIYEGFYLADDSTQFYGGTATRFIPNNYAVIFGRRQSGAKPGSFMYTLNINAANAAPAPYTRVIDRGSWEIPGTVEVHDGFNGGPTLKYPGAIVVMTGI